MGNETGNVATGLDWADHSQTGLVIGHFCWLGVIEPQLDSCNSLFDRCCESSLS